MFNKNLKAENPCPMDLLSRGGGQRKVSRESLVNSRKFNNEDLKLFCHSELDSESIHRCKLAVLAGKILKPSWIMRLCPKAWFWASFGFRFAHPTANPLQDDSYDNTHNELVTSYSLLATKTQAKLAFTMAEILLSLTIIGVVAAITLPSLTGNINERTWNTQRKALYSRFSQAIALMPAVNGYGVIKDDTDTASETFVTNGLSKVLQINNICADNMQECGIPAKITTASAQKIDFPATMQDLNPLMVGSFNNTIQSFTIKNTKATAFETKNGESVVAYTNPYCIGSLNDILWGKTESGGAAGTLYQRTVCANFIYDLNGKKGPNTVGKDIGVITVMYPSDPTVVAPNAAPRSSGTGTYSEAAGLCSNDDPEYRVPNLEESYSMFVNKKLLQPSNTNGKILTSRLTTRPNSNTKVIITATMNTGEIDDWTIGSNTFRVWCVKR